MERVHATYLIETPQAPEKAAAILAGAALPQAPPVVAPARRGLRARLFGGRQQP